MSSTITRVPVRALPGDQVLARPDLYAGLRVIDRSQVERAILAETFDPNALANHHTQEIVSTQAITQDLQEQITVSPLVLYGYRPAPRSTLAIGKAYGQTSGVAIAIKIKDVVTWSHAVKCLRWAQSQAATKNVERDAKIHARAAAILAAWQPAMAAVRLELEAARNLFDLGNPSVRGLVPTALVGPYQTAQVQVTNAIAMLDAWVTSWDTPAPVRPGNEPFSAQTALVDRVMGNTRNWKLDAENYPVGHPHYLPEFPDRVPTFLLTFLLGVRKGEQA